MAIAALRAQQEQEREKPEPKANADRIRAMSDEELAEIIMCPYDTDPDLCTGKGCLECSLEWLQQTANN